MEGQIRTKTKNIKYEWTLRIEIIVQKYNLKKIIKDSKIDSN